MLNPSIDEIEKDFNSLNFFYNTQRCQAFKLNKYFTKNTIIVDDTTIVEGSYGWTSKDAEGFSIALNGPKASAEIDRFAKMYQLSSM